MAPIITLTTDFGLQDEYAGVVKGVLLGLAPQARLVDICHTVEPGDVGQAAFLLQAAAPWFPAGTIHLAVVDPGVGTSRALLALRAGGQFFLAPDNGLLTPFLANKEDSAAVLLDCRNLSLRPASSTFHGRDILAPAAAALANGSPLAELGRQAAWERLVRLPPPPLHVDLRQGSMEGRVLNIDRFGNLTTNIGEHDLARLAGDGSALRVFCKEREMRGLSRTYGEQAAGALLALIGSRGLLELAVNQGSAARLLGAGVGEPVRVARGGSGQGGEKNFFQFTNQPSCIK